MLREEEREEETGREKRSEKGNKGGERQREREKYFSSPYKNGANRHCRLISKYISLDVTSSSSEI